MAPIRRRSGFARLDRDLWPVAQRRDTAAVSRENVERVRAGFAAHNRGDVDALVELYDPEAVFETLLLGTHHGNEAIRLIYEENQRTLDGYDIVPVELIDAGDKVVAVAQAVGTGPVSQIAVNEPFAFLFTFKGDRVAREQAFRNKEEALEAAGLA
jgi:ketosteroid isomerase-like protein